MLIDNKNNRYPDDGLNIICVWDFIKQYAILPGIKGDIDIVTGYFTLKALSKLYNELPEDDNFRIISSELVRNEMSPDKIINLLEGDKGIESVFQLEQYVKDAIAFLKRDNVMVRAITNSFCHAKVYLYKSSDPTRSSFFISGSSNMTDAGLGLIPTSNVELNFANAVPQNDSDYRELRSWFKEIWDKASDTIHEDRNNPKSKRIPVKEFFIHQIEDFYRKYTPEEIYYKILFEIFNSDLDLDASIEHRKDLSLLQTSVIWKTLFNYQQKGVISLIKMLRKYNGAILADAVGLGKTFSALAVIKYFQTQNYTTVLLCPKKIELNWTQYLRKTGSRFEADEFDYVVRFHTDFQNDRLENNYTQAKLHYLQSRKKILIVIDESHNLRNEKSTRYQELLTKLIQNQPGHENRDVKVLMLSATPINNGLNDVKGQFNLIAHGDDSAFNNEDFYVESLTNLFADAQRKYSIWCDNPDRTIGEFISALPQKFFNLTDKLIVARTRKLIEKTLGEDLGFPKKDKPINIYQGVDHFGNYKTTEEIYQAFDKLFLAAYQPSLFKEKTRAKSRKGEHTWGNDVAREKFLVKMMGILFMKRLESSWFSLMSTVKKVLEVHESTLNKVKLYISTQKEDNCDGFDFDEDEETGGLENNFSLRKGTIKLSELQNIGGFKKALESDVKQLNSIYLSLLDFSKKYDAKTEKDLKLDELERLLEKKKHSDNKKVVVFTVYADTAQFIYDELRKRGITKIAMVSGSEVRVDGENSKKGYISVLQRFAPYSKLYKELEWSDLYEDANLDKERYYNDDKQRWDVPYSLWLSLIEKSDSPYFALLNNPIDVLIATDCLSEGQNLQDADMIVNYDIHWNPVRLIQRFGRIDRIGSPNNSVRCVNFWPAKSFEDYLHLETRVTNRMATMNLVGVETQEINEAYMKMVADNPLQDKNADKLLEQLQNNSISDIETPQTLSMKDFSFELYRQDLIDYFEQHKDVFRKMPNGIFSGFALDLPEEIQDDCLVAVVGYPRRQEGCTAPYKEMYLLCQPVTLGSSPHAIEMNKAEILFFLRNNKKAERFVPHWIETPDKNRLERLSAILNQWIEAQLPKETKSSVLTLLKTSKLTKNKPVKKDILLEDKFKIENFDLITWEYVSINK